MHSVVVTVRVPQRQPFTLVLDGRLAFGREGETIVVDDPQVSRRHVALEPGPEGTALVTDLGSSNGTTVDGAVVAGQMTVRSGSVIRIGNTSLEIGRIDGETRSATRTEIWQRQPSHPATSIELVADAVSHHLSAQVLGVEDEAGTVTIVFSDIESSTQMAVALGDRAWLDLLQRHQRLVSDHVVAHRGRIVKHQGDGYMLCFRSARAALLSSIGIQRDLARQAEVEPEHAIRVRVGLHTGEVLVDDDGDLFGKHVVIAARIGALAEGGEILVSSLVRQIVEPRGDLSFLESRDVQLRGIGGQETVSSLDWRAFNMKSSR